MGKPNRTRRNTRKADAFKTFTTARRRKNTEKPENEEAKDELVERRSEAFIKLFDKMEAVEITPDDSRIIATFATKDGFMSYAGNQDITDLSDLAVEELTEVEFATVLRRAYHALNVILENRTQYVEGPHYKNRHTTTTLMKMVLKARKTPKNKTGRAGRAKGSASASKMVAKQKEKRAARAVLRATN